MELKEIRKQLRLAMNGVVSTSMRQKGAGYRMNFGVSLPQLKTIAAKYTKESELAQRLWQEDVREMKILALLLYPETAFSRAQAETWGQEIDQPEIAELYCFLLLQHLSFAEEVAFEWIEREEGFFRQMGFLLSAHLFRKGFLFTPEKRKSFMETAQQTIDSGNILEKQAAITAINHFEY